MVTIGCIGCGNMGGAIMRGIAELKQEYRLLGFDTDPQKIKECGVIPFQSMAQMVAESDVVLLAVKPHIALDVLHTALESVTDDKKRIIISVAAGVGVPALRRVADNNHRPLDQTAVIRCMPNTPVAVGMGAFALCLEDPALTEPEKTQIQTLFAALGRVLVLPESQFAAFTALMGCGPAYIFYVLDALAEVGVRMGFSRKDAQEMASWLGAGSATLALKAETPLAVLREQVCSPAGSTIEGIAKLDQHAVRAAFADAVLAALDKEQRREQ